MPVAEMLQRMDSAELSEWMAYYQIEPFGERLADHRAGLVTAAIYNVNRPKNRKAYSPSDFMPKEPQRKRNKSASELRRIAESIVRAF